MNIRIFGPLEDITGSAILRLEQVQDTDQLREKLLRDFPELRNRKFVIAVDNRIVQHTMILQDKSEVALLPPFSGG
jgi:molybdopterin converting factor small subunit